MKAASGIIENFPTAKLSYLGEYHGADAYCVVIEGMYTGFPFVFLYKDNIVSEIIGDETLSVISFFGKEQS